MRDADRAVAVTLYRAVCRLARRYDRDPALKALLTCQRKRDWDDDSQQWYTTDNAAAGRSQQLARKFLRGGAQYRPAKGTNHSMVAFVQAEFSREYSRASLPAALDAGLAAMLQLGEICELGAQLPRSSSMLSLALSDGEWRSTDALDEGAAVLVAHPTQLSTSFGRALLLLLSHSQESESGAIEPPCTRAPRTASRLSLPHTGAAHRRSSCAWGG